jgi:glutathione S-transferase
VPGEQDADVFLYGAPASLYTAKVRAWLSAFHVAFQERFPSHLRYRSVIRPAVETHRIPVVEFPDGTIVQDSTVILDAFERRFPDPNASRLGPCQRLAVALMEALADRGLAKPAMHYRWSFLAENEAYLVGEFGRSLVFPAPAEEVERLGRRVAAKMAAYLPMLGVDARTAPAIEASYGRTLGLLEAHFARHPFALGGAPSRADCALMGPLFGHLARDPYPRLLMQQTAPLTFRWTERMAWGERQAPEFPNAPRAPLPNDEVPATLVAVMRHVFAAFADELGKSLEALAAWRAAHPDRRPGDWISPEGADQPALGPIVVDYHGVAIEQQALGHPLWLLQRARDVLWSLGSDERSRALAFADAAGAADLLTRPWPVRLTRVRNRLALDTASA